MTHDANCASVLYGDQPCDCDSGEVPASDVGDGPEDAEPAPTRPARKLRQPVAREASVVLVGDAARALVALRDAVAVRDAAQLEVDAATRRLSAELARG